MNDHGTNVQCDKCKEWVSGSHNCDTWSLECGECRGEGGKWSGYGDYDSKWFNCPTCHGKRIELEMEEHHVFRSSAINRFTKQIEYTCVCGIKTFIPELTKRSSHYRPMTVEMVNDLTCSESEPQECPTKFDPAICYTCEYCTYKGASVRIKGG